MTDDHPLIVQGDFSLLLEVQHPLHTEARDALARFTELVKAPEYLHTYRISPLSVWNAAAAGMSAQAMLETLTRYSRYAVPRHVIQEIETLASRFGLLTLLAGASGLELHAQDMETAELLSHKSEVMSWLGDRLAPRVFSVPELHRGRLKVALIKIGYPARDLAGYLSGEPLSFALRSQTRAEKPLNLRDYQWLAVDFFHASGQASGGSGVIVLPCGAGKTVVGMGAMERLQTSTLILTPGVTAARQWIAELLDKTSLTADQVGEYTGHAKEIRPVTVTTYQTLSHRNDKEGPFVHFGLFNSRPWGLIIYDEVHLLPAPIFQVTSEIQARRRLGLTATLVREDNRQDDVFALIGPKKYDVSWKEMERQGWIAKAECTEVRVCMSHAWKMQYAEAAERLQFRVACENPAKLEVVKVLLARHPGTPALVIGTYLEQLETLSRQLNAPLLTGQTSNKKREALYEGFRSGQIPVLVVSKVANFAVDLPDAALAIQVSGSFGSRQEEAQRLGRLLRPKPGENQAHFYTVVSRDSLEQELGLHRQLFLIEQGYRYVIEDFGEA